MSTPEQLRQQAEALEATAAELETEQFMREEGERRALEEQRRRAASAELEASMAYYHSGVFAAVAAEAAKPLQPAVAAPLPQWLLNGLNTGPGCPLCGSKLSIDGALGETTLAPGPEGTMTFLCVGCALLYTVDVWSKPWAFAYAIE
jgi:hypothetical protein